MAAREGRQPPAPPVETAEVERLLAAARQGDTRALGELLERLRPQLLQLARRRLGRHDPAGLRPSDLAQDTVERAVRSFERFAGTTAPELQAWLKTILINLLVQHRRASGRQKRSASRTVPLSAGEAEPPTPDASPSQHLMNKRRWQRLLAAIFALPPDQREAVRRYLRGAELAEIAAALKRSKAAVSCLLQRGTATLRQTLAGVAPPAKSSEAAENTEATEISPLESALLHYLELREQGAPEARDRVLNAHPECATALGGLVDWLTEMQTLLARAD
jgi:RNA polymerase sigma-70 factor (ECF subfamily)